jgi:hypothetical protein
MFVLQLKLFKSALLLFLFFAVTNLGLRGSRYPLWKIAAMSRLPSASTEICAASGGCLFA